jgi:hypothetical protein
MRVLQVGCQRRITRKRAPDPGQYDSNALVWLSRRLVVYYCEQAVFGAARRAPHYPHFRPRGPSRAGALPRDVESLHYTHMHEGAELMRVLQALVWVTTAGGRAGGRAGQVLFAVAFRPRLLFWLPMPPSHRQSNREGDIRCADLLWWRQTSPCFVMD